MIAPDPQTVRRLVRRSLQNDLHRLMPSWFTQGVGSLVQAEAGPGVTVETFTAWHEAVVKEVAAAQITVSWPDEQQPADPTAAEQPQDGAAADVVAFLDAWEADRGFGNTVRGGNGDIPHLFATDLRTVLAERDALVARVAELEGRFLKESARLNREWVAMPAEEAEADVRAVAALLDAEHWDVVGTAKARSALRARFADRIAAPDADADGGAE